MRRLKWLPLLFAALAIAGCERKTADGGPAASAPQIAWREGDVGDAFAEAKEEHKPVLLYWGAKWCLPCTALKQTLFKDPAFVKETRNFVAVHLDGDAKGAQVWGAKFGGVVYPQVIVLRPDQSEITRLSGSSLSSLTDVLRVAAGRTSSNEDLFARAEARPASLSADDWRLIASFDWGNDPRFPDTRKKVALLQTLAGAAPDPAIGRQLLLTGLILGQTGDKVQLSPIQQAQTRAVLAGILSNYDEVKLNDQVLGYGAADLIDALPDAAEREKLGQQLVVAMDRVAADESLPIEDRVYTASANITLSKAQNGGKVAPAVLAKVRRLVAMVDREATNPLTRQAVMPTVGQDLFDAGDHAGGERLYRTELGRSVAPWYYMSDLGDVEEADKHDQAAIDWFRQAAERAEGPATRVQWAILYSQAVMRMTPDDKAAVERSAKMVVTALSDDDAGYADRTRNKTIAWSTALRDWSAKHDGAAVLQRLQTELAGACGQTACKDVLKT